MESFNERFAKMVNGEMTKEEFAETVRSIVIVTPESKFRQRAALLFALPVKLIKAAWNAVRFMRNEEGVESRGVIATLKLIGQCMWSEIEDFQFDWNIEENTRVVADLLIQLHTTAREIEESRADREGVDNDSNLEVRV